MVVSPQRAEPDARRPAAALLLAAHAPLEPDPPDVIAEATELRTAVAGTVPAKSDGNLLVATWNLRAFGGLTPKWAAGSADSPKRDWRAVALIAAIVGQFDVVAVQEVKRDLTALRFLLDQLGPTWHFLTSDVAEGDSGNDERLTFLFDSSRIEPSGLVGEIVLPPVLDQPARQFVRTPYAASFLRGPVEFILTTVHILWGARSTDRVPELQAFASWMRSWADRAGDWNGNLLVLGDFNIDRLDDPLFQAFVSTGLWPPTEISGVPRTIFDNDRDHHFYDQIAWFSATQPDGSLRNLFSGMEYGQHAGSFDFVSHVYAQLGREAVSWRISDHYPLWVEFRIQH